ncbi:MAG: FAD-binding oxidoreductase [Armatimonadetes bacterium]|nr:FAD-binding oxidoreductase [Armatimonadota bacterium]
MRGGHDTIVVGGGVVGMAIAYELAVRGQTVLVLEKDDVGAGASGVSGGFVCQQAQRLPPMASLVREGVQRFRALSEQLGADIGLRPCGSLILAADEAEAEALRRHAEALTAARVPTTWLAAEEVRRREPLVRAGLAGALLCESDVQLDPPRLLRAYHGALVRLGCEVRERRVVVELLAAEGRVTGVRTRYGDLDADTVVVAAGCWTPVLLPETHAALIHARRGQVLVARPRRRCVQHLLLGADYLRSALEGGEVSFTLEQTVDGALRLGATRERAGYDSRPAALLERVEANARRYVELPDDVAWSHAMAGLRPSTTDGLPLVGPIRRGLWLAAGHHTVGLAAAPSTAARLAATITGQPADLRAFQPRRFMSPDQAETS